MAAGECTLLGLWGDPPNVHMAPLDEAAGNIAIVTYACADGRYPSVGAQHPPALRLERAIRSLFGLDATGSPDTRPWLDLGFWDVRHPLGNKEPAQKPAPYAFLPVEGEGLHQIPVGPVHAGIIEPGHFRFTANGEHVVRLEQRLGYVHKGIESLMAGATLDGAAKLACAHLRRQHGRLCLCFRAGRRGRAGREGAAARGLPARADGGARAAGQSFRRHRRHLQRCLVRDHACANRHPARARVARGRRLLRPPADDGRDRARRRRARYRGGRRSAGAGIAHRNSARVSAPDRTLRQHRLAAGPHRHHRHRQGRLRAPVRRRRLCRTRLGPRLRRAPHARLRAL